MVVWFFSNKNPQTKKILKTGYHVTAYDRDVEHFVT